MPLARASELDRLLRCHGALVLPTSPMPIGTAAAWGNMVHDWLETGVTDNKALLEKLELSGTTREQWWPKGRHEIPLAYNVLSSVVCSREDLTTREEKDAWKASFGDEWITGTLDYAGELMDTPWVDDLKTGRFVTWEDYEMQQAFYCLAWGIGKYGEPVETRSTVTHWPRYPKGNQPVRMGRVLSLDYFRGYAIKLKSLREAVLAGEAKLRSGSHCRWCPSKFNCPEVENNGF